MRNRGTLQCFAQSAIHHHNRRRHIYASRRRATGKATRPMWNTDTQKQPYRVPTN